MPLQVESVALAFAPPIGSGGGNAPQASARSGKRCADAGAAPGTVAEDTRDEEEELLEMHEEDRRCTPSLKA